jgi:hypothetical protein
MIFYASYMCLLHSRFVESHPIYILEDGPLISEVVLSQWFEGELVFYLVYTLPYLHHIEFDSYLPNLPCFTYYTSLYLVDNVCHCGRVSRDEML